MAMANFRNVGSIFSGGSHSTNNAHNRSIDDIIHTGVLAKRKNNKSRYFVLRKETNKDNLSRLEYYESEKKFNEGRPPRKKYLLKTCSMICQKTDVKNDWVLTLYFHKNNVSFIAKTENDMNNWLQNLNDLKYGTSEGNPTIEYQHVWQVNIQPRSFCPTLAGQYFMCLTNRILSLVKNDNSMSCNKTEIQLCTIRRCGHVHQFFFIQLGRNSCVGSGILWMICEDPFIARNINEMVGNAMNHKEEGPTCMERIRERTSSVSEAQRRTEQPVPRSRSESVPGARNQIRRFTRNPSHYEGTGNESAESSSDEDISRCPSNNIEETFFTMTSIEIDKNLSPSNMTKNWRAPSDDDSEYVVMMNGMDPVDPVSSSNFNLSLYDRTDNSSRDSRTPVSPSGVDNLWNGLNPIPSPSDSRNSLAQDDSTDGYMAMVRSGSLFAATNPYLSMDKASAPISVKSDDDPYFEMSPNSGSSSMTSGTHSSDRRNNDLLSEKDLGSGEEMDSLEMRTTRTSSVGSRPEHSKRKNSAPMLAPSFVSRSCPGTSPGSYFRGFLQGRNHQHMESYKMEIDLSKNNSYDYIPGEERDRKTSKERLWHTLKSYRRPRSDSRSSGTSRCSEGESTKAKRLSECESRAVEIPTVSNNQSDYCQFNYCQSPRVASNDSSQGYVPMFPPNSSYVPPTPSSPRHVAEIDHELSSASSSSDPPKPYVDMTRGNSSSSALTINSSPSAAHGLMLPPPSSSQEKLPSSIEDFMSLDLQIEGEASHRTKKGSRRKSFKESAKRKKPDSGSGKGDADIVDSCHKTKTSSALTTLTNFMSRKPNSSSKSPLSPPGNLLPKAAKDSMSPFLNLTRSFCKTSKEELHRDKEDSGSFGHKRIASLSSQVCSSAISRTTRGGSMDITDQTSSKDDDKMFIDPVETSKLFGKSDPNVERKCSPGDKKSSDYINLSISDDISGSLPSLNFSDSHDYMNMNAGISSPQLSPPSRIDSKVSNIISKAPAQASAKDNYMLMTAPLKNNVVITPRPVIPSTLLTRQNNSLGLEKLIINDDQASSERSRSHSGPQGGVSDRSVKRNTNEGRPSSASSSPISYSPPTSPTLGSVSSLSEGGLSSASSTCTVVNVGITKQATTKSTLIDSSTVVTKQLSNEINSRDEDVNYICLDLSDRGQKDPTPKLHVKKSENKSGANVNASFNYVDIDFTESEKLKNTSLTRGASSPH